MRVFALVYFCTGLCLGQAVDINRLHRVSTLPPTVRISFMKLSSGAGNAGEEDITILASTPSIEPLLIELLDVVYKGEFDDEHMLDVMNVLVLRAFMSEPGQQYFRTELRHLLNKKDTPKTLTFKDRGLWILGNYPNKANEEVMIAYLTERPNADVVGASGMAVNGLKRIGSQRAIRHLLEYQAKHPPTNAVERGRMNDLERAIDEIRRRPRREEVAGSPVGPVNPGTNGEGSDPPTMLKHAALESGSPPPNLETPPTQWSVVVILIVAATVLLWLLTKRRN